MQTHWSDDHILLRPYQTGDIDAVYDAVCESIAEVGRWLPWCHADYQRAESVAWVTSRAAAWETEEEYSFGIFDVENDAFLGGCGLNHINRLHGFANLGYWVRTSSAGRGIATAMVPLLARFGFEEAGFTRIEIVIDVRNAPSLRVAEKVGATREGILRNRLLLHGQPCDAVMFSLIPSDLG